MWVRQKPVLEDGLMTHYLHFVNFEQAKLTWCTFLGCANKLGDFGTNVFSFDIQHFYLSHDFCSDLNRFNHPTSVRFHIKCIF